MSLAWLMDSELAGDVAASGKRDLQRFLGGMSDEKLADLITHLWGISVNSKYGSQQKSQADHVAYGIAAAAAGVELGRRNGQVATRYMN